jgi:nucleoside-diphosphate-sugar epimerase
MGQTVAITGVTGFVGGALLKRLTSTDWQIKALVRPASMHRRPPHTNVEWISGDLGDFESLKRLVAGVDAVLHCAGAVRGKDRADFERVNVDGVTRLVSAARAQHPEPQFVLISSLAAREPQLSHYAISKRRGEETLVANAGSMPWVIFRPPVIYGPGDRELLPLFQWMCRGMAPVIGAADKRVSLLYVDDMVEAVVCYLNGKTGSGCVYELHDGHVGGYTWGDIIDAVSEIKGKRICRIKVPLAILKLGAMLNLAASWTIGCMPMLTPGKVRELTHSDWVADNTALSKDMGWKPQMTLEKGLRYTLQ